MFAGRRQCLYPKGVMTIIDRYLTKMFLFFFFAGLLVFVTIFLAINALSFVSQNADAGAMTILRYYAFMSPRVIYQLFPVGALLATLMTLSTLSRQNELVALFSLGWSLVRVSTPLILWVAFFSAVNFLIGDQVVPQFTQKEHYVEYVEIKKKPSLYSTVTTNKVWYRVQNIIFNIKTLNSEHGTAQGLTLYYFDQNWQLIQLITAKEMQIVEQKWHLVDGSVTLFAQESSFPLTQTFKEKDISMTEDLVDLKAAPNSSDLLTSRELSRFIDRNKEAGLETTHYEVDYHARWGFAFSALVMAMLGIPFTVGKARSGGMFSNFLTCVGVAFGYWILYSSSLALGQHGYIPAVISAWGPNLLGIGLSIFLILRLKR